MASQQFSSQVAYITNQNIGCESLNEPDKQISLFLCQHFFIQHIQETYLFWMAIYCPTEQ